MNRITTIAALLGLAVLASPAASQLATGYSGQSSAPRQGTDEEFWYSLDQLGSCFASGRARDVRSLLATEQGSIAETRAFDALMGRFTSCLRSASRLTAPRPMIRSALAEGMYKKLAKAPLAPVASPDPQELTMDQARALGPLGILNNFAFCIAARHPAEAHHLLTATRMGSGDEQAYMDRLKTNFAQCTPPGMRLQFDLSDLRLAIAEAMYRRAEGLAPMVTAAR